MKINLWMNGFLIVLAALLLSGCGNEEKEASTKAPLVKTYVDEFKKSLSLEEETTKTDDGKYSLSINEDIFLFVTEDTNKKVKEAFIAATSEAIGFKELEEAQKALIHSMNDDFNEKQIYATLKDLKVSDTLEDVTKVKNIEGAQLTYSGSIEDDSSVLKAVIK